MANTNTGIEQNIDTGNMVKHRQKNENILSQEPFFPKRECEDRKHFFHKRRVKSVCSFFFVLNVKIYTIFRVYML